MVLKVPGQDKVRNRMRFLQARRAGSDCFIDTAGHLRAARAFRPGEIIIVPPELYQ